MKLVTYNIQYGFGLDGRYDLERIAASLAGVWLAAEVHEPRPMT